VEEARARLQAEGVPLVEDPGWRDPTHDAEVCFLDPNGLTGRLFSRDPTVLRNEGPLSSSKESLGIGVQMIIPHHLGHIGIQVPDAQATAAFYTEKAGLRLTEWNNAGIYFLRAGRDHHGLGLVPNPEGAGVVYHHVAWDIGNMTDLWNCGEFLRERDIPISLGPGWWEQGHQTELNFLDPDGQRIEIYCHIDQVADDAEPVGPSPAFFHSFSFDERFDPHAVRTG
jgi:catechol 2,3-dioxygenase-like lactoylglutathione lyase family enzyme